MKLERRCLYCGHDMSDDEHHADPLRDAHRPAASGLREVAIDASAAVDMPLRSQDQRRTAHAERAAMWHRDKRG